MYADPGVNTQPHLIDIIAILDDEDLVKDIRQDEEMLTQSQCVPLHLDDLSNKHTEVCYLSFHLAIRR